MKKPLFHLLTITIAISLFLASCGPSNAGLAISNLARVKDPAAPPADVKELVAGNTAFAFDLYQAIASGEGNLVYSPYSLSLAFALAYAGARGETAAQMAQVLHYTLPADRFHPAFNALDLDLARRPSQVVNLDESDRFQLSIANSVWGQKDWSFQQDYLDLLASNYGAGLRLVDFQKNPDKVSRQINDWVAEQTKDRIKDIIPPGVIDPATRLVLANAIYFKALWETSFNASQTHEENFNLLDGSTVPAQMMTLGYDSTFAYATGPGWQAISLPYKGGMNEMVLVVPDAGEFASIQKDLTADFYNQILTDLKPESVLLSLPKFKFETPFALQEVLPQMGMRDAFAAGTADFSGIDGARDLYISAVLHKAFIAVDEKGTEAAAATIIAMPVSIPSGINLTIDRPFFFFIRDIPSSSILFMGRVLDPGK